MKELIDVATLQEAKKLVADKGNKTKPNTSNVHCAWCANCAGIVGD